MNTDQSLKAETSPQPTRLFDETFTEDVIGTLAAALQRAYDTCCDHYEPKRGNNENTFGFELYNCAVHELCSEAKKPAAQLTVLTRNPTFRLEVGPYEVACHRVGKTAEESIWSSFPNNEGAVCTMVEEPLWLKGMAPSEDEVRKLVLAHFGNPDEGLCAVYLCAPSATSGQRITEWGFARLLWKRDAVTTPANDTSSELAPVENIEQVALKRKVTEEEDGREGQ